MDEAAAIRSAQAARARLGSPPRNKTVAATESGIRTLSGWKQEPGYLQTTRQVMAYSQEIGHPLTQAGPLDKGVPGRYNASHAEKQLSVAEPNTPIAVSSEMCLDCREYFKTLARYTGKLQVVADPKTTRIFRPDGTVDSLPTDFSSQ
ncbi:MAG: hypothetical protein F6J93_07785 [Oscillatoria sp. SIO1A7]|nr:hypothetical protein [Oscillatoria sp. SIO1A7]